MNLKDYKKTALPDAPGVYLFKKGKDVLYVGKATSLKDRVKSYFSKDLIAARGPLLVDMVFKAGKVEFEQTDSVLEALILEAYLIKTLQPKYNTQEKDDKSYNYVLITDEDFPKILIERGKNLDMEHPEIDGVEVSALYGPFPHGAMLKEALKIIRRIFPFIDKHSFKKDNYEFYRQLGLAPETASGDAKKEYRKTIRHIKLFFEGKKKTLIGSLEKEMHAYAKRQEFEKAGEVKKTLYALGHIQDVSLLKRNMTDAAKALRVEAYDIAHLSGTNMVGVMVALEDGIPEKGDYRKFNIKSVSGANDPAALKEVLLRRLGHTEWQYPSIIVVDGNEVQLGVAEEIVQKLKLPVSVVSVVKNEKHKAEKILGNKELIISYRDQILLANAEAHRFAIAFHRQKRGKLK